MKKITSYYKDAPYIGIIAVLTAAVYSNGLWNSFHFDDRYAIVEDYLIRDLRNIPSILSEVFNRPLLRALFSINYYFSGLDVFGYHLVNLMLHMTVSIQVYFLVKMLTERIAQKQNMFPYRVSLTPFLTALTFALHPLQTGSVTYIASRSAILAAFFYLLSIMVFLKAASKTGTSKHLLNLFSILIFILGLGAKETTVTIPLVVIMYTFLTYNDGVIKYAKKYYSTLLPWIFVSSVYILIRYVFLSEITPVDTRIEEGILPGYQYFLTELNVVIFHYLKWLIYPFGGPNVDPDITTESTFLDGSTISAAIIIIALLYCAVKSRKKLPVIGFGILWYFITLLPTSSVFPIGDVAVERHLYVPSIGFFIIAGFLLDRVRMLLPLKAVIALYILLFSLLGYLTIERNFIWRTELTLWEHASKKSPDKLRVLNNRAWAYYLDGNPRKSLEYYAELLERFPNYPFGYNNRGIIYLNAGDLEHAIKEFERAVSIRPGNPVFHANLASAYERKGLTQNAIREIGIAVSLDASNPEFLTSLASLLAKNDRYEEAIEAAKMALAINNKDALSYYILGYSYEKTGDFKQAKKGYKEALSLKPDWELPEERLLLLEQRK